MTRENTVNVPREPTEAMLDAAVSKLCVWESSDSPYPKDAVREIYVAMLSAAPSMKGRESRLLGVGADPRYEIDVTYEVWQGDCMVAGASDLNEARRYEALYQPCSLLLATTYRQPADLPVAAPPPPSVEVERLRERLIEIIGGEVCVMPDHGDSIDPSSIEDAADAILATLSRKQEPGVPTPGGEGE